MRGVTRGAAVLLLLAPTAADGAEPARSIRLPAAPVLPQPMPPAPDPGAVVRLAGDSLYVIDAKVDCVVRAHPAGLVKVQKKKGPRDISAKFVDGTGLVEDRTYDGPFVFVVTAAGTGRVELDVIPIGLKSEADIVTAVIDVDAGEGPRPPPKPDDPPKPKPDEPPPKPATTFQVLLVFESGDTLTAAQSGVLYGAEVEKYLTARCTGGKAGWGRRDKDADLAGDTTPLKGLWSAVKPKVTSTPALAIAVDDKVTLEPLPATPAAAVELLKKYAGDK